MTTFVEVTVVLKFVFNVTLVVQVKVEVAVAVSVSSQTKGLDNVLVMVVGNNEVNVTLPELQRVIVNVVSDPPLTVIIV
jgi:chorismate mutase